MQKRTDTSISFLYVDTFKVLSRINTTPTHLYGHCTTAELDELQQQLESGHTISAVFVESPGNPLLLTPDLLRLRQLADKHDFLVVCDDTIATSVNVDVLRVADVVWSSLTKMFSGACDTMGGTAVLNNRGRHYRELSHLLHAGFVDTYYPPDAIVMEKNSRDFVQRVRQSNANAELLVSLLNNHHTVLQVYHPSISATRENYDAIRRPGAGYSFLLSVQFRTPEMARTFFDTLDMAKGPSLGTNFTLACPYTLFAHYKELAWAAEFGLTEDLIRISVGIEEASILERKFARALQAAEDADPPSVS